jgi:hypothetical protein
MAMPGGFWPVRQTGLDWINQVECSTPQCILWWYAVTSLVDCVVWRSSNPCRSVALAPVCASCWECGCVCHFDVGRWYYGTHTPRRHQLILTHVACADLHGGTPWGHVWSGWKEREGTLYPVLYDCHAWWLVLHPSKGLRLHSRNTIVCQVNCLS